MKILVVFGTRPEAIKMCPVVKELYKRKNIQTIVCVTGQHKEMLEQVLSAFEVIPDFDLSIMRKNQSLFNVTTDILLGIEQVLKKENPDIVLVHGDTTTTFATALACYYLNIPVGHVEAGLRTNDIYSPFPEEFNRRATAIVSSINFAPTSFAQSNLLNEGISQDKIFVTGNTAIDALKTTIRTDYSHPVLDWVGNDRLILITAHRRENLGAPMEQMFEAIRDVIEEFNGVKAVYPVHLNPKIKNIANKIFLNTDRIKLIEPLDVIDFHNFMNASYIILTDSGGIQEEAPSLGKPVLVMRDTTERPEGVKAGTLKIVGTTYETIHKAFIELLSNQELYLSMSKSSNPYGDGNASSRIVDILEDKLKCSQ